MNLEHLKQLITGDSSGDGHISHRWLAAIGSDS
jgi:hypothetical protein